MCQNDDGTVRCELALIMPIYNEGEVIASVITAWREMLDEMDIVYRIHAYDDGSKDNTRAVLQELASTDDHGLTVHTASNQGHGPTILKGYRDAKAEWIFQVDSDDELLPEDFAALWAQRSLADLVIGWRKNRKSPLVRRLISSVSRLSVHLCYGYAMRDVNIPYRLMRSSFFKPWFRKIPEKTFAPNVIISGIAAWQQARVIQLPVKCQARATGEVSIRRWKLFRAAVRSLWQTVLFRFFALS